MIKSTIASLIALSSSTSQASTSVQELEFETNNQNLQKNSGIPDKSIDMDLEFLSQLIKSGMSFSIPKH